MDKIQATGNRNKVLTGGMIDVAQDGSVLQGVYAPAVLVRNEAERDALPADYPPGTIAFTPGQAQKWQKTQDGAWADYVGGSGSGSAQAAAQSAQAAAASAADRRNTGMDKIQATGNRNKVLTGGMIDVAQDGSVLQGVYAPGVMVRDEAERDALPADYPPGTIAFTPGEAQKWQKTQDGAWADYVGGSGGSGSAQAAAQSAQDAAQSAQDAAQSAQEAAQSAQEAAQHTTEHISDWLDNHPEATTTVQDGSITRAKLDADLQQKTDEVSELKSALDTMADFYSKETNVALSGTEKNSFITSTTEKWSTSGSPAPKSWVKSVPEGAVRCKITANNDHNATIAFLTSSDTTTGATPNYCIGTGRISIPAGTTMIFNVPSDAKYIYVYKSRENNTYTPSVAKWEYYVPIPIITVEDTTKFTPDFTANPGKRINAKGTLSSTTGFSVSDMIQLPSGTTYVSIFGNIVTNSNILELAFYKTNEFTTDSFISGVKPAGKNISAFVPSDANYIAIGSNTSTSAQTTAVDGYYFSKSPILKTVYDKAMATTEIIKTPDQYDLVVGDTFELFFKGVLYTFDPDAYMVLASCSKGNNLSRKYTFKPTASANLTLTFDLYNKDNKIQETKSVALKVHAVPTNPGSRKTVLCVGDSLTQNGVWVEEFARRMTGSGGAPAAYGLSNIAFIGTCERNGVKYEGHGGWTFEDYNTNGRSAANERVITCTHNKTEAQDQHSEYKDGANNVWKLETITETKITLVLVSGTASSIPNSGTLTWVSGGQNHSDITYTAVENAPSNPFWSVSDNAVNFQAYVEGLGESTLDYVYVLLGWNNWSITSVATYKAYAKTFVDNVIASYPNAKIVLMGLEVPGRDGLGLNYASNTNIANYIKMLNYVFNVVDVAYKELASDYSNVYYMNTSGQFDTEYNMQMSSYKVNTRNSETMDLISNGIHPATSGYLQIADAATRHLVGMMDT